MAQIKIKTWCFRWNPCWKAKQQWHLPFRVGKGNRQTLPNAVLHADQDGGLQSASNSTINKPESQLTWLLQSLEQSAVVTGGQLRDLRAKFVEGIQMFMDVGKYSALFVTIQTEPYTGPADIHHHRPGGPFRIPQTERNEGPLKVL